MADTGSWNFGMLIGCFGILMAAAGLAILILLGRKWHAGAQACWRQVAEHLGLTNFKQSGIYPQLRGTLEGVQVELDIMQTRATAPGSRRPWTRIRAQLPVDPPFQIRSRHQKYGEVEWPAQMSGDPDLDARYEFFWAEGQLAENVLPASIREVLRTANPPVHVLKNVALWIQRGTVRDAGLLIHALQSCARVAGACRDPSM